MENTTSGVTTPNTDKSTTEIREEMVQTRESITEKVAALETQVMGTIQNAADTVTNTVDAVKEAVSSAPSAVSDTVKQTVDAVKQSFHDTIGSFSISGTIGKNPWASLGTSLLAGFLTGFATGGGRKPSTANFVSRTEPAPVPRYEPAAAPRTPEPPGLVSDLCNMMSKEVRELAEQSLSNVLRSLKQSINSHVPEVVDAAVNRISNHLQDATSHRDPAYSANGR